MSQLAQDTANPNHASPPPDPTPFPWTRFFLLVIANILYVIINKPDIGAFVIFNIVTIGSINLFEPVLSHIDRVDQGLTELPRNAVTVVRQRFLHRDPVAPRTMAGNNRQYRRTIFNTISILIVACFLLQNVVIDRGNALRDHFCIHVVFLPLACPSGIGIRTITAPDNNPVTIGLITSANRASIPFDTSGMDGTAAEQDVEEKILVQEDVKKQACKGTHITLVVVTMLSRTISDTTLSANVGLEDLRGAYLKQQEYNQQPAHTTKLCLAIANIGTRATASAAIPWIMEQIILFARVDATFRGVVGFPFSSHSQDAVNARSYWQQNSIPIVTPSASSSYLSNEPNFYRVVSSDQYQSEQMAQFIQQHFLPKAGTSQTLPTIAIFYDVGQGTRQEPDAYSNSLATAFNGAIQRSLPGHVVFQPYILGNSTNIKQQVHDAIVNKKATLIFFAGYSNDIDAVEAGIQSTQPANAATSGSTSTIAVFGGDGLYDLTRYIDNPYSIVYSTVYAPPLSNTSDFVQRYNRAFPQLLSSHPSAPVRDYTLLPPHSILSYDATQAFLVALDNSVDRTSQESFNQELATVKFNGLSGAIVFQGNSTSASSDPSDKAVYILCADRAHNLHVAGAYGDANNTSYPPLQDVRQCADTATPPTHP